MNEGLVLNNNVAASLVDENLIKVIEGVLNEVKAGNVDSIVVIGVGKSGLYPPVIHGTQPVLMHLGARIAEQALLNAVANPQNQSKIIRPPPGSVLS